MADGVDVVRAAQHGDRSAWECLYRRFAPVVHGVLLSRVPPQDAEDLTQEVFAKAMASASSIRDTRAIGAWLASVARNHATDHLRRRKPVSRLDTETPSRPDGTSTGLQATEVLTAIQGLPDAYRETLTLRLVEGLTGPQIADMLGMTHGSVRVNLHRGMSMLRAALGEEEPR